MLQRKNKMKRIMNPTHVLLLACTAIVLPMQAQQNTPSPNGVYYSAQRPWMPPLPFHPFPDLPAVEVESKRYVYDDTLVNYHLLVASGPPAPGGGGGGSTNAPPPYLPPTVPIPGVPVLRVELLPVMPGMEKGVKLFSFN